ncbi:MAG: hypothetical protein VX265_05300 [Myxococcota bacterium]|nr:hypothetical protein [Myxococcota bacterium]
MLVALLVTLGLAHPASGWAATGCSLRNPHTDIRGFFPSYSDYIVQYVTFARQDPGGSAALSRSLRDELDPLFESEDVPYTLYTVRQAGVTLGYVYGTNQRGKHGNLQVIAVTDADHVLQEVVLQTLRSPHRDAFLDPDWLRQLSKHPLDSWTEHAACYVEGHCENVPVPDPTGGAASADHRAILRALAKLALLRSALLHPGAPMPPRDAAALAERIGNHEAIELSRETGRAWGFAPLSRGGLEPDEPVVVLRHRGRTTVYPVAALRRVPVLRDGAVLLAWSETSRTASALLTDRPLVPTADLLFDVRLLREPAGGGTWAPLLGRTLIGPAAHAEQLPALVVPARVAVSSAPWAALWTGAPAPAARASVQGPRALLVERMRVDPPHGDAVRMGEGDLVVQAEAGLPWALRLPETDAPSALLLDDDGMLRDPATGLRWSRLGRALGSGLPDLSWPVQASLPRSSATAFQRP